MSWQLVVTLIVLGAVWGYLVTQCIRIWLCEWQKRKAAKKC